MFYSCNLLFAIDCDRVDKEVEGRKNGCTEYPVTKKRSIGEIKKVNDRHFQGLLAQNSYEYYVIASGRDVNDYITCKEQYKGLNGITERETVNDFVSLDDDLGVVTEHCEVWGIAMKRNVLDRLKTLEDVDLSELEVICTKKTKLFGGGEVFNEGIGESSYVKYQYLYACTDDKLYESQIDCGSVVEKCSINTVSASCAYSDVECSGSTKCEKSEEDKACKASIEECRKKCEPKKQCDCNKNCPDKKIEVGVECPKCDLKWYDFITLGISRAVRCPCVCPAGSTAVSQETCREVTRNHSYTDYKRNVKFDDSYVKVRKYDINICLKPVITGYPKIQEIYDPNLISQ